MHVRILKIIVTSGFLTALERTKLVFGRGSAPNSAGGAYSAPPDSLAGLMGLLQRGGEGRDRGEREKGRKRKGRQGKENRNSLTIN